MALGSQLTSDTKGDHLSVKMAGAVGDGASDDTAAIQAAIDYVRAHGGDLYFPPGTYLISSTLLIGSGIVLQGASGAVSGKTQLLYTGTGTAVKVINPSPTAPVPWVFRFYMRNFSINSTRGWNGAAIGLDLHNVSEFELKDVLVGTGNANGFGIGVRAAVDIGVINGLIPVGNHVGLSLDWTDEVLGPIIPCSALDIGGGSNFFNNDVSIAIAGLADSRIHNCWFEQFANAIVIDNARAPAAGCVLHSVTVDNNAFAGYTSGSYTDNRALRLQSTNNAKIVSVINFRWRENSCFAVGSHVVEFVVTGSHANTIFEGTFDRNELWGGTAGAINADSSAKIFVMLHQNDSRDSFFGAVVPDIDPAAVISANGFDYSFSDFLYATFRQGIKSKFTSKFATPLGDAVWVIGPNKAYVSFSADGGLTVHGVVGYPTTSDLTLQLINDAPGQNIIIQTTGPSAGSLLVRGGALETDAGYGALGAGSINPAFGGGGAAPLCGSLSWGDGTGYTYIFGTKVGGVFTARFTFKDNGDLLVHGALTVTSLALAAPIGAATIPLAKLTGGGMNGSITVSAAGLITGYVIPT